jgi:hypothetical protein
LGKITQTLVICIYIYILMFFASLCWPDPGVTGSADMPPPHGGSVESKSIDFAAAAMAGLIGKGRGGGKGRGRGKGRGKKGKRQPNPDKVKPVKSEMAQPAKTIKHIVKTVAKKLPYPGNPKKKMPPMELGSFKVYTDINRKGWRSLKKGERVDKFFSWVVDGKEAWSRLMAEVTK